MDYYDEVFPIDESEIFFNKIDEDLDYAFALSLEEEEEPISKHWNSKGSESCSASSSSKPLGIVDEQWELLDPNPDIHALFIQYNKKFFYGRLDQVEVKWSPRMYTCAGVCSYEGRGGLCSVRLSLPLLKLRPRRDLVETLLHEMIHAYLFVTANNKDHSAHGPEFLKHMSRINKETGTRISVYHSFHDEVDLYRKHWWKCNGPCQKKRPFFGLVKRAANRAPGPTDFWWSQHQSTCGGTFIKIKEPENYKKSSKKKPLADANNNKSSDIKKFLVTSQDGNSSAVNKNGNSNVKTLLKSEDNVVGIENDISKPSTSKGVNISLFSGKGIQLGSSSSTPPRSFLAKIRKELKSDNKGTQLHKKQSNSNSFSMEKKNVKKMKTGDYPNVTNRGKQLFSTPMCTNFVQSSMETFVKSPPFSSKGDEEVQIVETISSVMSTPKVICPVCFKAFTSSEINLHLDRCLSS